MENKSRKVLNQGEKLVIKDKEVEIKNHIGSGGSCLVYEGIWDGKPVIVKEFYPAGLDLERDEHNDLVIPVEISAKFNRLKENFISGQSLHSRFYGNSEKIREHSMPILFEHGEYHNTDYTVSYPGVGTTLANIGRSELSLLTVSKIMVSVCDAISAFHKARCLYLDIKPENFFYLHSKVGELIYVCDFDTIIPLDRIKRREYEYCRYSLGWVAPEQLLNEQKTNYAMPEMISYSSDIFSIGCVFFWLLTGYRPQKEDIDDIAANNFRWKEKSEILKNANTEVLEYINSICSSILNLDVPERKATFGFSDSILEVAHLFEHLKTLNYGNAYENKPIYEKLGDIKSEIDNIKGQLVETFRSVNERTAGHGKNESDYQQNAELAQPQKRSTQNTRIVSYSDLRDLGMKPIDIANRLVENDYALYEGQTQENEGTPEQWAEYLSCYPQTFRYLLNEKNEIVGNWSFCGITEGKQVKHIIDGTFEEAQLKISDTDCILTPGDHICYILNFSANEGYNTSANIKLLSDAFFEQMLEFATKRIFFKTFYVNAFRKDHEAFFKGMGFEFLRDNTPFGRLYQMKVTSAKPLEYSEEFIELKNIYRNHYKKITYRPMGDNPEEMTEEQLKEIARLIYQTDPYIYPAMFESEEDAMQVIPEMILRNDTMFCKNNLYLALCNKEIIGLILWHKGPLNWNSDIYMESTRAKGSIISPIINRVEEEYFSEYASVSQECISLINICVDKKQRNHGTGRELIKRFLKYSQFICEEYELYVLKENSSAVHLYESLGFEITEELDGFSPRKKKPRCYRMILENDD